MTTAAAALASRPGLNLDELYATLAARFQPTAPVPVGAVATYSPVALRPAEPAAARLPGPGAIRSFVSPVEGLRAAVRVGIASLARGASALRATVAARAARLPVRGLRTSFSGGLSTVTTAMARYRHRFVAGALVVGLGGAVLAGCGAPQATTDATPPGAPSSAPAVVAPAPGQTGQALPSQAVLPGAAALPWNIADGQQQFPVDTVQTGNTLWGLSGQPAAANGLGNPADYPRVVDANQGSPGLNGHPLQPDGHWIYEGQRFLMPVPGAVGGALATQDGDHQTVFSSVVRGDAHAGAETMLNGGGKVVIALSGDGHNAVAVDVDPQGKVYSLGAPAAVAQGGLTANFITDVTQQKAPDGTGGAMVRVSSVGVDGTQTPIGQGWVATLLSNNLLVGRAGVLATGASLGAWGGGQALPEQPTSASTPQCARPRNGQMLC